jgi:hypothetical protein
VLDLSMADGGVALAEVHRDGESTISFLRVVQYPRFHDWIDISKQNDRLWLISTARNGCKVRPAAPFLPHQTFIA